MMTKIFKLRPAICGLLYYPNVSFIALQISHNIRQKGNDRITCDSWSFKDLIIQFLNEDKHNVHLNGIL